MAVGRVFGRARGRLLSSRDSSSRLATASQTPASAQSERIAQSPARRPSRRPRWRHGKCVYTPAAPPPRRFAPAGQARHQGQLPGNHRHQPRQCRHRPAEQPGTVHGELVRLRWPSQSLLQQHPRATRLTNSSGHLRPAVRRPDRHRSGRARLQVRRREPDRRDSTPAGTVAMANSGTADTNGSQFFLVYPEQSQPARQLHAVWPRSSADSNIIQNVAKAGSDNRPTRSGDGTPKEKVEIESVTIKKRPDSLTPRSQVPSGRYAVSTASDPWGRVAEDGTVYVRTAERRAAGRLLAGGQPGRGAGLLQAQVRVARDRGQPAGAAARQHRPVPRAGQGRPSSRLISRGHRRARHRRPGRAAGAAGSAHRALVEHRREEHRAAREAGQQRGAGGQGADRRRGRADRGGGHALEGQRRADAPAPGGVEGGPARRPAGRDRAVEAAVGRAQRVHQAPQGLLRQPGGGAREHPGAQGGARPSRPRRWPPRRTGRPRPPPTAS